MAVQQPEVDETLNRLMRYVESLTDYKVYLYGWVLDKKHKWIQLPQNNDEANRILQKALMVSGAMTKRPLHGWLYVENLWGA